MNGKHCLDKLIQSDAQIKKQIRTIMHYVDQKVDPHDDAVHRPAGEPWVIPTLCASLLSNQKDRIP